MTPFLQGYMAAYDGQPFNPFFLHQDPEPFHEWNLGYDLAFKRLACARQTCLSETPQGVAARSIPGASPLFKAQFNRGGKEQF